MTYGLGNRPQDSATAESARGFDEQRISVAQKVATDIAGNDCERLIAVATAYPELARLVRAWPKLSATVRRTILAALDADQGQGGE